MNATTPQPPEVSAVLADLPRIRTALKPDEIGLRMLTLAKRGKLPSHSSHGSALFQCDLFGEPLDYRMACRAERDCEMTLLCFTTDIKPRTPAMFWIIAALTVQPGMWMTDSMIRTYITSYDIPTWWWYLPLTVLPVPFVWMKMLRKSRASAVEHAQELLERIRAEVDGTIER